MLVTDYMDAGASCLLYTGVTNEAPVLAYLPSSCTQVVYGVQHQTFQTAPVNPPALVTTPPLGALPSLSPGASTNPVLPAMKLLMSQHGGAALRPVNNSPLRRIGVKRRLDSLSSGVFVARDGSIKPLHCAVCQVTLNAPAQARQHYEGKNHARKVKMSQDEGDSGSDGNESTTSLTDKSPSPADGANACSKPAKPAKPAAPPVDPEVYCAVCCMSFNSSKQARQHYQGKNHGKRLHRSQRHQRLLNRQSSLSISSQRTKFTTVDITSQPDLLSPRKWQRLDVASSLRTAPAKKISDQFNLGASFGLGLPIKNTLNFGYCLASVGQAGIK